MHHSCLAGPSHWGQYWWWCYCCGIFTLFTLSQSYLCGYFKISRFVTFFRFIFMCLFKFFLFGSFSFVCFSFFLHFFYVGFPHLPYLCAAFKILGRFHIFYDFQDVFFYFWWKGRERIWRLTFQLFTFIWTRYGFLYKFTCFIFIRLMRDLKVYIYSACVGFTVIIFCRFMSDLTI